MVTAAIDWVAVGVSVRLAAVTTVLLILLGTPLAYWLARTKRPWKVFVEAVVALPLVLPPTVLGFYVLWATGSRSPLGRWIERVTGGQLPFTFRGLVVASVLYSLPFAVQPLANSFGAIEERYFRASLLLGDNRLQTFLRMALPLSYRGVLTAAVLTFAHTVGEFGVVLMVGGNIAGSTRTVSIAIYDSVQALDYTSAAQTAGLLLAVSFAALVVVYSLASSSRARWPRISS